MALPPKLAKSASVAMNPPQKQVLMICGYCGMTEMNEDYDHPCKERQIWEINRLHFLTCPETFDYFGHTFPGADISQINFVWEYDPWVLNKTEQAQDTEYKISVEALSEYLHVDDGTCIISGKTDGQVVVATPIIPHSAKSYMTSTNPNFGESFSLDCAANFLLLRSDLAAAFENQEFVLLLKDYNVACKTREYVVCVVKQDNTELLSEIHGMCVLFELCAAPSHRALFYHGKLAFRSSLVGDPLRGLLDRENLMTSGNISEYEWDDQEAPSEQEAAVDFDLDESKKRLEHYFLYDWGFSTDFVHFAVWSLNYSPQFLCVVFMERMETEVVEELVSRFVEEYGSDEVKMQEMKYVRHVFNRKDFSSGIMEIAAAIRPLLDESLHMFDLIDEAERATEELKYWSNMDKKDRNGRSLVQFYQQSEPVAV